MMTQSNVQALLEPIAKSYRDFHRYRNLGICWSVASAVIIALLALHKLTGWSAETYSQLRRCGKPPPLRIPLHLPLPTSTLPNNHF